MSINSHFICPLTSARITNKLPTHVHVNKEKISPLADQLLQAITTTGYGIQNWSQHDLHPKEANDEAIEWIFLIDSLNFSFWTPKDQSKYCINYNGNSYTGYWALCAAINKGIESGIPLTDPTFYSQIDNKTLMEVFKGESGKIPLLEERMKILHENGKILLQNFGGKFKNCIEQCDKSAQKLLEIIVNSFPSFRDQCMYKENEVSFYKRAQILIADIWACFKGQGIGNFEDIDSLTMFADYRVPQVLEYFGILKYSQELKKLLNQEIMLESGSIYEVEIRGQSIYAVDLLAQEMREKCQKSVSVNSILIDFYLWDFRRQNEQEIDSKTSSFHKVRCIYY